MGRQHSCERGGWYQVWAAMDRGALEHRSLFVALSDRRFALETIGDLVRRLEDRGDFTLAGLVYGREEDPFTLRVY